MADEKQQETPKLTLAEEAKAVKAEAALLKDTMARALKSLDRVMDVLEKPYLEAARKGDVPALRKQLDKGARLLATDDCGNTALFFAAQGGHIDAVKFLLEQGIPLDIKNRINSTPLMGAAGHGHMEVAKLLVEGGSDPFYKNATGMSAYGYASSAKRTDMLEYLKAPRGVEEVELHRRDGDRRLREVFNFAKKERTTYEWQFSSGPGERMTRDAFDKVEPSQLRKAFDAYQQKGGKLPEADFFPPVKVEEVKPVVVAKKKRRWGLF
jgi:Ankyrin repeats (3 copies)